MKKAIYLIMSLLIITLALGFATQTAIAGEKMP
jgi:hypothetical protein